MRVCEGLLRKRIAAKELLITGAVIDSRTSSVVELYKELDYDVVLIDREHSCLNSETICDHIRICRSLGLPCMVRVAEPSYAELNRSLDQAPDGFFVPRVETAEQVKEIIQKTKYRPVGRRGLAGSVCPVGKYIGWNSVPEQIETVNRNLVVGVQIENESALANLDAILSVKGVDIAVVGNDDLTMSLGIPGQLTNKKYQAVIEKIILSCQRHNVMPGIAVGAPNLALFWIKKGMRMIWYSCDIYGLWLGLNQQMTALRKGLKKR